MLQKVHNVYKRILAVEDMKNILVGDIMTQNPISVEPSLSVLECAKTMVKKNVGSLVVKEGRKIIGLITQEDILWALVKKSGKDLEKIRAGDVAKKKVHTISPDMSIEDAMKKMQRLKFERFPVVNGGELVGLLTMKDVINFNPGLAEDLRSLFEIREESEKLKRIGFSGNVSQGVCEECGKLDLLNNFDGLMLCANCREEV